MSGHDPEPMVAPRVPLARHDPLGLAQLLGDATCVPLSDLDGAALVAHDGACGGCTAPCPSDFVPINDVTTCSNRRPA